MWAGGTEHVYHHGSMALNNCFAGDEQFYTAQHGVTSFAEHVGEELRVLTEDGWIDATVNEFGTQQLNTVTFAPARPNNIGWQAMRSNTRSVKRVTADHRWELIDGTVTTSLKVGDVVPSQVAYVGIEDDDYREGFKHGFVFGDGTKQSSMTYRIRLCGAKDLAYAGMFDSVSYPEYANGDGFAKVFSSDNLKEYPTKDKPVSYIAGFIHGWFAADASIKKGVIKLASQNTQCVDWLTIHAPLAGYIVTGASAETNMETNFGTRKNPLWVVSLSNKNVAWKVVSIEENTSEETVYCVTNPTNERFTLVGGIYTSNCGFKSIKKLSRDAAWCMNALMLGVGVGYDTYRGTIHLRKPSNENPMYYNVPDSREGWVESLRVLIESYEEGGKEVRFDYSDVRPKGSPIKGFGGIASGYEPLRDMHEQIRSVLDKRANKEISSVRCIADTINLIAKCVISGNVRRSALIALGRPDDEEFLNLKNWNLPENFERMDFKTGWGHTSNNSVVLESAEDFDYLPKLAPLVSINAEPGVLNLMSVQKYARRGEKKRDRAIGVNPCGEIALEDGELCNLVEVFPTRCKTEEEYFQALRLATTFASIVSLLETEEDITNAVIERNRRIGVSISGIVDWLADLPRKSDFVRLMNEGYDIVKEVNAQHAIDNRVPASVRLTTVKPSGSISLLAGVSAGMHHPIFRRYIRRMKVDAASPLVSILTNAGIPSEPDSKEPENTLLFEFPVEQKNVKPQDEVSLHEHGMRLITISRFWADNAASNTTTFKATLYEDEDGNEVPEFMHPQDAKEKGYKIKARGEEEAIESLFTYLLPEVKSVSMSPTSQSRTVYPQSPYESITVAELERRQAMLRPVDWSTFGGSDGQDSRFCTNDSCIL